MSVRRHIAMCVDRDFALPLAVALASIDASPGAEDITVHILQPGLPADVRARVQAGVARATVSWITVDEARLRGAHYTTSLSIAALYRLLLDELLPDEVERVLYLDADTVVEDALDEVFAADLRGGVLGAVRDANTPWAATMNGSPWRQLGLDPGGLYFNSGVLLIDRTAWRDADVGSRCLRLLRRSPLRWGDQDALNGIVGPGWTELPLRWNVQTSQYRGDCAGWALWPDEVARAIEHPGVIHFTETAKPWHHGSEHPAAARWERWLERTAWAGWRSLPIRDPAAVRAARRLLAALRRARAASQRRALRGVGS
ncbi:glycosyltransferase [Microbacterium sp. Marseille-Q6965]|uniref:glycosyltransferase family 8 protein n=1 Tax=Microbacterium sp. Marseille-Q6965 TaxID=2965072 RepID=UPI0021B77B85|nr:glycosyltransferase [Microbacterium sp. Marseille-Q6965]